VGAVPLDGRALVDTLLAGPTNELEPNRAGGEVLSLDAYNDWFSKLPEALTAKVRERWGKPEDDPFVSNDAFQLALHRFGNVAIGIQPTRGYNIDPEGSYHDPDLVPPHGYLAFYAWIRGAFDAHAVTHFGKHGNLEWLPGKALALSENCFPDAVFGPTPNIYPFIVNDPGEGTQAKRRNQALVLDHLTPPLTRAETYGDLAELERLIDEYFEASTLDPRRLKPLKRNIFDLLASLGLDKDLGIDTSKQSDEALATLDAHLCELKELQIRDGLHIYGLAPSGEQKRDLLLALARLPQGQKPSFLKVLVDAYDLGFDPLACDYGAVWQGAKPDALNALSPDPWRTYGDTVERLELMAIALLDEKVSAPSEQMAGHFNWVRNDLGQLVERCGTDEVANFLKALQGEYVAPGPSGAPTRGRLDVLPTGRNFYSIDSRALPTAAAWRLGWQSANQLLNLHAQEHGDHLRRLAISMWGTANMRTGGDDIAQVLALLGVQPQWDLTSGRVTGFEVMPQSVLGRPRVDVTIRVSGFFRDAFPAQIDLMDSAIRAVAALDEPANLNPLAAEFTNDTQSLMSEQGMSETQARVLAGHRVFGSKPESYGAGLQALIDEGGWDQREELGQAYMAWSAFAYGHGSQGTSQADHFKKLLGRTQAIVHNQDNREHDILDSDDYYQFMGGLSSAVWNEQGQDVPVYHGDNSRPESPQVRSLEMEIARVMRSRVTNPKWIEGVMRHGYKGAFEMSATVDYLFGFAASTSAVASHHFDAVFKAYVQDDNVRSFLQQENPDAFADIVKRLQESLDRGLWQSKHNTIHNELGEWLQDPRA
ncbi:MAG: cobaltochelatase subunit CobN, partial [Alphaproteobacteria bacterium]